MPTIYQWLNDHHILFIEHHHPAVFTSAEAAPYYANIPGAKAKNLFLRNRKGDRHYLVIITESKRLQLKSLAQQLQETDLSFASAERLQRYLGLTPGSVSPFGLINDQAYAVQVIIDAAVWQHDRVSFHPSINTSTLELARSDFENFLNRTGHPPKILPL